MVLFSVALEGDKSYEEYQRCLQLAIKYGFYSFQIYEHISYRPAWSILFQIAGYVRRSHKTAIGPVTVPVQLVHPFYTAANAAALCGATGGGKVVLGISRGAFYEMMDLPKPERPITAVKEAVEIIDSVLKRGRDDYRGKVFSFSGNLKWKYNANIELYVGSSGPKMIQTASGMRQVRGIVVDNLWSPTYATKVKAAMESGCGEAGRNPADLQLIARPFCAIVPKQETIAERVAVKELHKYARHLLKDSPMVKELGVSDEELQSMLNDHLSGKKVGEQLRTIIERFVAIGTPDDIIEQTDRMVKAGVSHVCYGHPLAANPAEGIELLAQKVKPHFQQHDV